MEQKYREYRAKEYGSETYIYGHKYIAYIDKGGHNHCVIHNYIVDEYIPVDECTLQEIIDNKWVKMKKLEIEIW